MQPTLLQSKVINYSNTPSGNATIGFDNPVTPGSFITVTAFMFGNATEPTNLHIATNLLEPVGIFDTYAVLPGVNVEVYYPLTPSVSPTQTITLRYTAGQQVSVVIREYANMPTGISWPANDSGPGGSDATNSGNGTQLDSTATPIANHQGRNLMLAYAVNDGNQLFSVNSNFGNLIQGTNGSYAFAVADLAQNVINVPDASFTLPTAANWACGLVDFYIDNPACFVNANVVLGSSTSSSVSATFGASTTPGNILLATVSSDVGAPSIPGWTLVSQNNYAGTKYVSLFQTAATGSETTITATAAGATIMKMHLYEISDIQPLTPDGTPATSGSAAVNGTLLTGSITTTNPRVVVVVTSATGVANGNGGFESGGSFTAFPMLNDGVLAEAFKFGSVANFAIPSPANADAFTTVSTSIGTIIAAFDSTPPAQDPLSGDLGTTGVGS